MVMDVYAMESALLRTQRVVADKGAESAAVQLDITRVFLRDAAARVEQKALAVATETENEKCAALVKELAAAEPIKAIAARRRIADAIIAAGKYIL